MNWISSLSSLSHKAWFINSPWTVWKQKALNASYIYSFLLWQTCSYTCIFYVVVSRCTVFTILHNMLGYWVLKLRFWLRDWENWTRLSWQPSPSGILLAAWRPYWHRLWLSFLFFHLHIVKKIKYWKFYLKFWHSSK